MEEVPIPITKNPCQIFNALFPGNTTPNNAFMRNIFYTVGYISCIYLPVLRENKPIRHCRKWYYSGYYIL